MAVRFQRLSRGLADLELELELELELKRRGKKSGLDTLKTLYGESAIALCYYYYLASKASNLNIIIITYYMQTLDGQVLDLKN